MKRRVLTTALWVSGLLSASAQKKPGDITISQHGKEYILSDNNDLTLEAKPFSIRFLVKPYTDQERNGVQIAALGRRDNLELAAIGKQIDQIPYFAEGTSLASEQDGYSSIFLDDEANHYIYYTSDSDKRAKVLEQKNGLLLLEWSPHSFYLNASDGDTEFAVAGVHSFFLVFLNDVNHNNIIDPGELHKVAIHLK